MNPYDWLLARRTLALGAALSALAFLVMVGTDDASSSLGGRFGRLAALASIAGGGAAFLVTEQARSRGELRALDAAGVAPSRAVRGAVAGGALLGLAGAVLALARGVDLEPLFPRVASSGAAWTARDGGFIDAARGLAVAANGELSFAASTASAGAASGAPPRGALVIALSLAALGAPLWATARAARAHRWGVALAVAALTVGAFHLVAAGRASPLLLALPCAVLLADAIALHRGRSWR